MAHASTAKAKKFNDIEDAMKKLLAEMKEKETAVQVSTKDDPLEMLAKVEGMLQQNQYTSAEALLRHVYRIVSSYPARKAIASARKLCKSASEADGKWVKRRALLMRKKVSKKVIQAEASKYVFESKTDIFDLLATAILEIGEVNMKNEGSFYSDLIKKQEVILPPLVGSAPCVLTKAPIFFNSTRPFDSREAINTLVSAHGEKPDMKRLERGFHIYKNANIVGVPKKMDAAKIAALVSKEVNKPVSVVDKPFSHKSSMLFWYVYNFPIQVEVIYFADAKIVGEMHGDIESSFEPKGPNWTRDKFVLSMEENRRSRIHYIASRLRDARDRFNHDNSETISRIKQIENSLAEINERQRPLMEEFYTITSLVHSDENPMDKLSGGLHIGQYRRLHTHYKFLYSELSITIADRQERANLRKTLFEDRMKARGVYYDYLEIVDFKRVLSKELKIWRQLLEREQTMARGGGKSLTKMLDVE